MLESSIVLYYCVAFSRCERNHKHTHTYLVCVLPLRRCLSGHVPPIFFSLLDGWSENSVVVLETRKPKKSHPTRCILLLLLLLLLPVDRYPTHCPYTIYHHDSFVFLVSSSWLDGCCHTTIGMDSLDTTIPSLYGNSPIPNFILDKNIAESIQYIIETIQTKTIINNIINNNIINNNYIIIIIIIILPIVCFRWWHTSSLPRH